VIAGVGGGFAEYLGIDPVLIRIALVALAFAGVGVLGYVLAWIVIPEAPADHVATPPEGGANTAKFVAGLLLVGAGVLYLLDWFFPIRRAFWPLTLIAVGVAVVVYGTRR
jgi:phage shock protein C